jgi:hypothetical protein
MVTRSFAQPSPLLDCDEYPFAMEFDQVGDAAQCLLDVIE